MLSDTGKGHQIIIPDVCGSSPEQGARPAYADRLATSNDRPSTWACRHDQYQRDGDRLIPNLNQQALIGRIKAMRDAGSRQHVITVTLNTEGIGGKWYAATVRKVLVNALHPQ
ncbi:MAG: hypothetical protein BWY76_00528 [bacterium ADurb.Bin429]|nr:MAG: hypothetical protein BWY76_00528 [bacterium ADurb.Bin429]